MKPGIHPEYVPSKITCACGRVTETYATVEELHVEICSHCHPFYTGRQKLVDTAGRVERFRRKYSSDDDAEADGDAETDDVAASDAADDASDADKPVAVAETGESDASDEPDA